MSLLRSPFVERTPWRALILSAAGALVLPAALGAIVFGANKFAAWIGQDLDGNRAISGGLLLMVSPLLGLAAMILALPLSSALIRAGLFGWLPAALVGAALGGFLAALIGYGTALPFGIAVMLMMRAIFGLISKPGQRLNGPEAR